MQLMKKYGAWIAFGVIVVCGVLWEAVPLQDAYGRLARIPRVGPDFRGVDIPLDSLERSVFARCNVVKRVYNMEEQAFMLYVIDGTRDRNAIHDPTLCFTGSGWEFTKREPIEVPGGTAELLTAEKGDRTMQVVLWFSEGDKRYYSVVEFWRNATLRRLSLGKTGGEPVRVMLYPADNEKVDWAKVLEDFDPLWNF